MCISYKLSVDNHPLLSYLYYMKEVHITVKNISPRQWNNLLLELNLVKTAWKRYGPDIKIKAKNFDKIIKLGRRVNGEDIDNSDSTVRWDTNKRKL